MIKYIRKNQKKVLAIFSVGLMVAFALPTATSRMGNNRETTIGTIYGGKTKLMQRDLALSKDHWSSLKTLRAPFGQEILPILMGGSQPGLGKVIVEEIDQNEETFMLLVKEAQERGIYPSDLSVKNFLNALNVPEERFGQMYPAVMDLTTVLAASERAANVYKLSQPDRDNLLAMRRQEITLNAIEFSASEYLTKVPAPTEDQIKQQYEKYRTTDREKDPNGFGYHFPNRVRFDAVTIREDEVRKAIKPVEPEDQYEYFLRNQNSGEFVTTTQPAANSPEAFRLDAGPATRPMTFKEAQEKIVKKLTEQRSAELMEKVRDTVRNILKADYEAYRVAIEGKKPVPNSSLGVGYDSFKYLQALRDKIQKDFGIAMTIEDNEWVTNTMLADSEIGKYFVITGSTETSLADNLTRKAEIFLAEEQKNLIRPDLKVAVWQPTLVYRNSDGNRLAIARITEASPAHDPKSLDEVRTQVVSDVQRTKAYEMAMKEAEYALDSVRAKNWLAPVAADAKRKMITVGPVLPPQTDPRLANPNMPAVLGNVIIGVRAMEIPNLELKAKPRLQFVRETFSLLNLPARSGSAIRPATRPAGTQPAAPSTQPVALKDHPVGLIRLPSEGKVFVAEIEELKPRWVKSDEFSAVQRAMVEEISATEMRFRVQWYLPENVKARTGFKAEQGYGSKHRASAPPLDNPFLGQSLP